MTKLCAHNRVDYMYYIILYIIYIIHISIFPVHFHDWHGYMYLMQEVCQEVANWVLQEPRIQKHYYVTDPREVTRDNWYGVLTLIKIATFSQSIPAGVVAPALSCVYQPFSPSATKLGRGILIVRGGWGPKCTLIGFGNVHLESPIGGVTPLHRKEQLDISAAILRKLSPSEYACMRYYTIMLPHIWGMCVKLYFHSLCVHH